MPEKKQDFVVTDRRKFTEEGELRSETAAQEEPPAAIKKEAEAPVPEPDEPEAPEPTPAEHAAQRDAYDASGRHIDALLGKEGEVDPKQFEMTFERLVGSLYMTALVQLGAMHEQGKPVQPDIISARQTVDTLSLLSEKTKGNLTPAEQNLLQNALFELRMAFVEVTNALTRSPQAPPAGGSAKR
jgi:Domain of unknown function (DUF1844)